MSLAARMLEVLEQDVLPLTREGIARGNKIFGAAVLLKEDASLVVAGTNREIESPLWHGEMAAIAKLYALPRDRRPAARDCLFLSSHEPCSMCLSAITWAGFDNIYYFFEYEKTKNDFRIPHDLRILSEVFRCKEGGYARENAFWKSRHLLAMIDPDSVGLRERARRIERAYAELSREYQSKKGSRGDIPLP